MVLVQAYHSVHRHDGHLTGQRVLVVGCDMERDLLPVWHKTPLKMAHVTIEFKGVIVSQISGDTGSVLRLSLPPYHRAQQPLTYSPNVIR
jgi:hypothetical protein